MYKGVQCSVVDNKEVGTYINVDKRGKDKNTISSNSNEMLSEAKLIN